MADSQRLKRRRRRLLALDPFCPDCGVEMTDRPGENGRLPPNFATIEHVNSRIKYPDGRPIPGETILLCSKCNGDRARAEEKAAVEAYRRSTGRVAASSHRISYEEAADRLREAVRRMREAEL